MAVVSFRVSDKVREEMAKMDIDWSEVLRRLLEERILFEKRRRSAARMDVSRRKTAGVGFDSAKEIRKMRDAR